MNEYFICIFECRNCGIELKTCTTMTFIESISMKEVCQMNNDFYQRKVERFSNERWGLSGEGRGIVEWTLTTIRGRSSEDRLSNEQRFLSEEGRAVLKWMLTTIGGRLRDCWMNADYYPGKVEWGSFVKWTKISIRRRSRGSQMNADDYLGKVEGLLNERGLLSGEGQVVVKWSIIYLWNMLKKI